MTRLFVERLTEEKIDVPAVSIGSTPTMTAAKTLDGIDEIRPGNYAFFDVFQSAIGPSASVPGTAAGGDGAVPQPL